MSDRQTYTVVTDQPLAILGRMHKPGTTVALHPKQAAAHLRAGALIEGTPAPAPAPRPKPRAKTDTTEA
jgi:hypothetical protein